MISVIFPTFNEQENLEALYSRLNKVSQEIKQHTFEFIFVDDCSSDNTPKILSQLAEKDRRVKIIRFARNCGSHAALSAGLKHCQGQCAVTLAADLQDPPEIIFNLINEWERGFKIVWGMRAKRKGESVITKGFSRLYYLIMNSLTDVRLPPTGTDVFLIDRTVIDAFKEVTEKHTSVFMTLAWLGFKNTHISYIKEARHAGRSKWTLGKKIKLTLDSLLAFSDIPIRWMSVLGCMVAVIGFIYAGCVFLNYLQGTAVDRINLLVFCVLTIGGIQMIMLGIIGEYLWRTFDESRRRPRYVIEYKSESMTP